MTGDQEADRTPAADGAVGGYPPNVGTVDISGGKVALVDPSDAVWLREYRWHIHRSGRNEYACRSFKENGQVIHVYMHHHLLLKATTREIDVHHVDGDSLNNQRENLRYVSHAENVTEGFARKRRG